MEIKDGIFVHAEKERYYVFFDRHDASTLKYYRLGELISEITAKDACRIVTEEVSHSVHLFPLYDHPFSEQLMQDGYDWLCGFMDEDEKYPVAMAIGRASLHKIFLETAYECEDILDRVTIGEFMDACAAEQMKAMSEVFLTIGAITYADIENGILEPYEEEIPDDWDPVTPEERRLLADNFWQKVESVSETWGGKHKNQKSRSSVQNERVIKVIQLISPMDVLVFEQCRIQREGRKLKRCENW